MERLLKINKATENHIKLFILVNPEYLDRNLFYKFISTILTKPRNKNHYLLLLINKDHERTQRIQELELMSKFKEIEKLDLKTETKINKLRIDIRKYTKSK